MPYRGTESSADKATATVLTHLYPTANQRLEEYGGLSDITRRYKDRAGPSKQLAGIQRPAHTRHDPRREIISRLRRGFKGDCHRVLIGTVSYRGKCWNSNTSRTSYCRQVQRWRPVKFARTVDGNIGPKRRRQSSELQVHFGSCD